VGRQVGWGSGSGCSNGRVPDRRTFLALAALGGLTAACSSPSADGPRPTKDDAVTTERFTYGADPAQHAELFRPAGASRGVVVVIHGGFWRAEYDATLGVPLAQDLALRGWTAWNLEYRRVGNGGGVPATLDDVAAGIDLLADVSELDTSTVVTLGHSAGGHLATWAAARGRFAAWRPERVKVTAVISQAGVLDLTGAHADGLGNGAVEQFVGAPPGASYDRVDPILQVPLDVPVWCVHGSGDDIVPLGQSAAYVAAARAAGGHAVLVEVEGDHFVVIDPASAAWRRTIEILDTL
jgi:acetyl esterase/lipase